jgi:hypothetical protein
MRLSKSMADEKGDADADSLPPMENLAVNDQVRIKGPGKAKQKKAKRVARQAAEDQNQAQVCSFVHCIYNVSALISKPASVRHVWCIVCLSHPVVYALETGGSCVH